MPFLARTFHKAKNDVFKINHALKTWMELMFLLELVMEKELPQLQIQGKSLFINN